MRDDIKNDGKFIIAGELLNYIKKDEDENENIEKKGDDDLMENRTIIDFTEKQKEKQNPKLGEVYYANLKGKNHMQQGKHPVVIVQNNIGNQYSTNIQVVPLTSSATKSKIPTYVFLPAEECGLYKNSIAQCEGQIQIDKSDLEEYITKLPAKYMGRIGIRTLINTPSLRFVSDKEILEVLGFVRQKNRIVKIDKVSNNPNPKTAA